ncbi:MAG: molybdopterin-containing oxidoreductase family protein [Acidimicrobiales bacterium]
MTLTRRQFLAASSVTVAGFAFWRAGAFAFGDSASYSLASETISDASPQQAVLDAEEVFYTADAFCASECGLKVTTINGVIAMLEGNVHVPYNAGTICAKGGSGKQVVYSPYRLKYPMIRVGARGEGKFRQVSWAEAASYVAERLVQIKSRYGPESVIMDGGDMTDQDPYWRLFYYYGTPNCVQHGAICDTPRRLGPYLIEGGLRIEPDLMRPVLVRQADGTLKNDYSYANKLIIYVGWNPFTATRINYESRGTVAAKQQSGARVVVVDPAFSNTAAQADQWLPIRPGTDPDLFAAMLRYILTYDNPSEPGRQYIDWSFLGYSLGWPEFEAAFKSWWTRTDPLNGKPYFSLEWAAERTGLSAQDIATLADEFGKTKPACLDWGMNGTGHHFNGEVTSTIGTVLNVITGNFDAKGGAIDTALVRANKGGTKGTSYIKAKAIQRTVDGKSVSGLAWDLELDNNGAWPAAFWGALGAYPKQLKEGVQVGSGPFAGYSYPIKGFFVRGGNPTSNASTVQRWAEVLTAKDSSGNYKVELTVYVDNAYLETGMYADVILPEASFLERMGLSDIYPSEPIMYLREPVVQPLFEAKNQVDIMNTLAQALHAAGDPDIQGADFWEKYRTEEDFWNEELLETPGRNNVGTPLPYPQYPVGYKLLGTPDSLEAGQVTIDHTKKIVQGAPVTVAWLRANHGVAVWPMAWERYKTPTGSIIDTNSGKFEFHFGFLDEVNKHIAGGPVPYMLEKVGWTKYPTTFFWYETVWNPYTNLDYAQYSKEYPFQLISGRIHHSMSATQYVDWLGRISEEHLWMPLNDAKTFHPAVVDGQGGRRVGGTRSLAAGAWSIAVIQMNASDGQRLRLKTGDLVRLVNPLGQETQGKVLLSELIRPGVLRIPPGSGNRTTPGMGATYEYRTITPSSNRLLDPDLSSPITGMSTFGDMVVKVVKV